MHFNHGVFMLACRLAFNDNNYSVNREDGLFSATVHLGYGEHEYKFIVDGEWKHDPNSVRFSQGNRSYQFSNTIIIL